MHELLLIIINLFLSACLLKCFSLGFFLHLRPSPSSSIKFQRSITFHISITGDITTALLLSGGPQVCPAHQLPSRFLPHRSPQNVLLPFPSVSSLRPLSFCQGGLSRDGIKVVPESLLVLLSDSDTKTSRRAPQT